MEMKQNSVNEKHSFKNKDQDFSIEEIHKGDVETIVEFQKHLAIDSEGIQLNEENVHKAAHFLIDNQEYGIHFIIRTLSPLDESVSFALMCPEHDIYLNQTIWWYNSVFTEKKYRRRGLFAIMHDYILKWAGQSKIKLYADEHNEGALKCYEKLGLKDTNEIFVESDFFFTKDPIQFKRDKDIFNFKVGQLQNLDLIYNSFNNLISINDKASLENRESLKFLLSSIKQGSVIYMTESINDSNSCSDIICMAVFGYEYSEWKLGFNLLITDVRFTKHILDHQKDKAELIIQNMVSYFRSEINELEASVQSIRFVVDRNNKSSIQLLSNAQLQPSHYIILSN